MNAICSFRKCTLSDEELLKKVDELTDNIYKDGKIPTRHVPARPNSDFDLLVGELVLRFKEKVIDKICQHEFVSKSINGHFTGEMPEKAVCHKCGYEP